MAPSLSTARVEREKKVKALLEFGSGLEKRINTSSDANLIDDLQTNLRKLPLPATSTTSAKSEELDGLGIALWNLCSRISQDETLIQGNAKHDTTQNGRLICLVRVFAVLLLDAAGGEATKSQDRKACIRLLKPALKAARACIQSHELNDATKVLERAAVYQEVLGRQSDEEETEETGLGDQLRVDYYAVRMTLAWRQDRMDMTEHMFAKIKQMTHTLHPSTAESLADVLYEIGRGFSMKRDYELAASWLERSYDTLEGNDLEMLSTEAGELRLSIMQNMVQAYMKLKSSEAHTKAWAMVQLCEAGYGDKMAVHLLKLELLSSADTFDTDQFFAVLSRMIRTVVMNEINFKTIMHHVHTLKTHHNATACKILEDLIQLRLFAVEDLGLIEKALITRIWIGSTSSHDDNALDQLHVLFETVYQNIGQGFSPPATHAAQTLLWKRVEADYRQELYGAAESWCRICLHSLFVNAGEINKSKIARKAISCALARRDHASVQEIFSKMTNTGQDDSMTQYLMYKAHLQSGELEHAGKCLESICRQSSRDPTLLYSCVIEARSSGHKHQALFALEYILNQCDNSFSTKIHLPALLRCIARELFSNLFTDAKLDEQVLKQICNLFEAASKYAKRSNRKPSTPAQELFTVVEFEWFSKNSYNLCLKYCAEVSPVILVRILVSCIDFIKLLQQSSTSNQNEILLRLIFCYFLAACTFTTLARAEDRTSDRLQYYLEARKHGQNFCGIATEIVGSLGESARADIISKHFQIVKLELEAVLKLEKWDEIDDVLDQCFQYQDPVHHYDTLADLILIIHSCMVKAELGGKYQDKTLAALQKIINISWRQSGCDMVGLARWIRCLFQLALTYDENISLKCVEQATHIADIKQGTSSPVDLQYCLVTPPPSSSPIKIDQETKTMSTDDFPKMTENYPATELQWLATSTFNRAIDYYIQENDGLAKLWAEKAIGLAEHAGDSGELRNLLIRKYSSLTWQDE